MAKYMIIQTAIGDYRQHVLDLLYKNFDGDLKVLCGKEYFEKSTQTKVNFLGPFDYIENNFLFGRRALWQGDAILPALTAESVILEFNPRIISNWIIVFLRKIYGKKTVFWGHAWARAGINSKTASFRRRFRNLCDVLVVYTESQKTEVKEEGLYKGVILAAPNALYKAADMQQVPTDTRRNFIYVGRLVNSKEPARMLRAFSIAANQIPDAKLVIVGDGPLKNELESLTDELNISERVTFEGHISDVEKLKSLYSDALCALSPGYVGLSITQALGFGVPMIISRDEPHAPEIAAAREGFNSLLFEDGSVEKMAEAMIDIYKNRAQWISRSREIRDDCASNFSAEVMCQRLTEALKLGA